MLHRGMRAGEERAQVAQAAPDVAEQPLDAGTQLGHLGAHLGGGLLACRATLLVEAGAQLLGLGGGLLSQVERLGARLRERGVGPLTRLLDERGRERLRLGDHRLRLGGSLLAHPVRLGHDLRGLATGPELGPQPRGLLPRARLTGLRAFARAVVVVRHWPP